MAESSVKALLTVNVTRDGASKDDQNKRYKDAKNSMQSMEHSSKNILKNLGNAFKKTALVGWYATIKETTEGLIRLTKAQTEYIENLNLMQVAFGETKDQAESFINTLTSKIGFDNSTLTRQIGVFRQIGSAMQYDAETADLLSKNLTKMQLDISSLYNTSIERAGKSLESAITGNVMSIRRLTGADITQATLQQEALARGINKSTREMTRAEKTILIYLALERQLSNANGDVSRTINSVANQTKIFHDQIAMAGRQLSAFFIPILKNVLPVLNGILMAFNEIISVILGLFHIDAPSLASEFGTASSGIDIIGDSLDNVAEASDKAKKSLRGFDKLNNITTPTESSGGSVGGVGGLGSVGGEFLSALDDYNMHLDEMKNKAEKIKENIMKWLGFSKDVNGQWKWSGKTLLKNIWEWWKKLNGLAKIFVGFGIAIILKKIYDFLTKIINFGKSRGIIKLVKNLTDAIGQKGLVNAVGDLLKKATPFEKFLGILGGVVAFVDGAIKIGEGIKKWAEGTATLGDKMDILWGFLECISGIAIIYGVMAEKPEAVIGGIIGIATAIGGQLLTDAFAGRTELEKFRDTANDEIWSNLAIYQSVQDLSEELEKYIDENGKVQESDEKRVEYILGKMNDAFGTEYELIDGVITKNGEVVTSYKDIESEIDVYLAKIKSQMILESYEEEYNKALKKKYEYQQLVNAENDNYQTTLDYINGQYDNLMEKYHDEEKVQDLIEKARKKATDEHNGELNSLMGKYGEYITLVGQYDQLQTATARNNIHDIEMFSSEIIGTQEKFAKKVTEEVDKNANNVRDSIKKILYDSHDSYNLGRDTANNINKGMDDYLKTRYDINISANGNVSGSNINFKAEGGFVSSGDIFVANENNRPEYVGSFGNRTAVANTDQIVDGISIGVARAMASVKPTTDVNIVAKGDTSGLLNFIEFEQQKKNRQFGL